MLFLPAGAMLQKEARKSGIAAKNRQIERGGIPVSATRRDRPAESHHEPGPPVAALGRQVRQQAQSRWRQRSRQVGPQRPNASRFVLITARAGGNEALVLGNRLRSSA